MSEADFLFLVGEIHQHQNGYMLIMACSFLALIQQFLLATNHLPVEKFLFLVQGWFFRPFLLKILIPESGQDYD